jgi:hypothetical protein
VSQLIIVIIGTFWAMAPSRYWRAKFVGRISDVGWAVIGFCGSASSLYCVHRSLSTIWSSCREPKKSRIAFGKTFTALPPALCLGRKKRRSTLTRLLSSIPCNSWEGTCARLFCRRFKTGAFLDLQRLQGPPHSRRKPPRIRIHHVPNAKHYSHP